MRRKGGQCLHKHLFAVRTEGRYEQVAENEWDWGAASRGGRRVDVARGPGGGGIADAKM